MFKKGDKVYSILRGWGEVKHNDNIGEFPVYVEFATGCTKRFTTDGKYFKADIRPELYFTEPVITVPKRRVEHKGWIWVFDEESGYIKCSGIYETEKDAKSRVYRGDNDDKGTLNYITYYTKE